MRLLSEKAMTQNKEQTVRRAKADLSQRLKTTEAQISEQTIEEKEFPDASLGAPLAGEMSAQMITSGYQIRFNAHGKTYEYRADATGNQLRLFQFNGTNHIV